MHNRTHSFNPKAGLVISQRDQLFNNRFHALAEKRAKNYFELTGSDKIRDSRDQETRTKMMAMLGLDTSNSAVRARFDEALASGRWTGRDMSAIALLNKIYARFEASFLSASIRGNAGIEEESIPLFEVQAGEFSRFMNAVGVITTGDIISENMYRSDVAFTAPRPTLLDYLQIENVDELDINELVEDTAKVEGSYSTVAEGAALPQVDFGTKKINVNLKSFGAYMGITEEVLRDSNFRRSLQYVFRRMILNFRLTLENQVLNGSGSGNNFTGLLNHSDAITGTDLRAADGYILDDVNGIESLVKTIRKNAEGLTPLVVINSNTFDDLLMARNTDQARLIPEIVEDPPKFGDSPVVVSEAVADQRVVVHEPSETVIYLSSAGGDLKTGRVGDDFTKLRRTVAMYSWGNVVQRFGNRTGKVTKA